MDPQQELFSELMERVRERGYGVYDGELPPKNTPYPFVYIGDSQESDDIHKSGMTGEIYQEVHVWHNSTEQRGTVSSMLLDIKRVASRLQKSKNYSFMLDHIEQNILPDNTTDTPLLHGYLELRFKFS